MSTTLEQLMALGKRRRSYTDTFDTVTLTYRGLSSSERREWIDFSTEKGGRAKSDDMLIAMALCDANGSPQFPDAESRTEAMELIGQLDPVGVIKPLVQKIMVASGMAEAEEIAEKK